MLLHDYDINVYSGLEWCTRSSPTSSCGATAWCRRPSILWTTTSDKPPAWNFKISPQVRVSRSIAALYLRRKVHLSTWELASMDERKLKERRVWEGKGGKLSLPVGLVCVEHLSIRFHSGAQICWSWLPPSWPFPHTSATTADFGNPPAWP